MMKPIYSVTIGSLKLSNQDGKQGGILAIHTNSGVNQINEARLILPGELEIVAELEDTIEISLGESNPETVYTGVISEIRRKTDHVDICVVSQLSKLSSWRTNRSYQQRTCGNIVKDLIETPGVTSGKIKEGLEYPAYTIDNTSSAYAHLLELSMQNGYYLYADVDDQLTMDAPLAGMTHLFAYGKNILSFEQEELQENITGVDVYGESPLSHGQGKEAYTWLSSKEVLGSAGDKKGSVRQIISPALKDIDSAQVVAENILLPERSGNQVTIKVLGNPKVKLLDQFLVRDIPGNSSSTRFQCHEISHSYESGQGFTTQLIGKEL